MASNVDMGRYVYILLAFAVLGVLCGCNNRREKEAELRRDLSTMRDAIDKYTTEKLEAPQSLDDLVKHHYLRSIPDDPFTGKKDWVPFVSDTVMSVDQTRTGIANVHSNSMDIDREGNPYNTW